MATACDECNNVSDPITLDEVKDIPSEYLFKLRGEKVTHCFDIRALYNYYDSTGKLENPFNRTVFSEATTDAFLKQVIAAGLCEPGQQQNMRKHREKQELERREEDALEGRAPPMAQQDAEVLEQLRRQEHMEQVRQHRHRRMDSLGALAGNPIARAMALYGQELAGERSPSPHGHGHRRNLSESHRHRRHSAPSRQRPAEAQRRHPSPSSCRQQSPSWRASSPISPQHVQSKDAVLMASRPTTQNNPSQRATYQQPMPSRAAQPFAAPFYATATPIYTPQAPLPAATPRPHVAASVMPQMQRRNESPPPPIYQQQYMPLPHTVPRHDGGVWVDPVVENNDGPMIERSVSFFNVVLLGIAFGLVCMLIKPFVQRVFQHNPPLRDVVSSTKPRQLPQRPSARNRRLSPTVKQ